MTEARYILRRTLDGQERILPGFTTWTAERDDHLWGEGMNRCDCRRYAFFQRVTDDPEDCDGVRCGTGAYGLRVMDADTGSVLFEDVA